MKQVHETLDKYLAIFLELRYEVTLRLMKPLFEKYSCNNQDNPIGYSREITGSLIIQLTIHL